MEKTIELLKKELYDLRKENNAQWYAYGSELCTSEMLSKEKELEDKIIEMEIDAKVELPLTPFGKFKHYLINVGIRSSEYSYTPEQLFANIDYFRECYEEHLSAYKALQLLDEYLKHKRKD